LAAERTRIQLCGRLSVEIDGVQLAGALRGRQVPLVFAYLVLNRDRYIGRDELSHALWPDRVPRSQDASLRTLLSRLRSAVGSEAVVGRERVMLALPERMWIDVEAAATGVERAVEALDRGDAPAAWALAQVPLNISGRGLLPGSHADWLEPHRRELEDLRLQALEVIGRAGLVVGGTQLASVQRSARALIEAEPYRESGYVLLMQAMAAEGNRAEGVRVFERLRTLLREELGTAPSPDAITAHEMLLRPAPRRPLEPARAPFSIELPPELRLDRRRTLVGRERELAELERLFEDQPPEAPPVALVRGDPGVGKSRLAAELARRLHQRGAVVLAGSSPQEPLAPYQPFLEALRHYVAGAPIDELQATVREHGSELQRLLPELGRRIPELPPPAQGEPETERYRLFEAVLGVLARISASSPLLLVLDDLHWADRPTVLLLRHLASAPRPAGMSILAAYRHGEEKRGAFGDVLEELRDERLVSEFRLAGLREDETAQLVASRTQTVPSATLVRALHAQTEGNPLFTSQIVRELLRAGVDISTAGPRELHGLGLPEDVRRVISYRLAGLGDRTEEWLRVAAVIGRDFDASLVERVSSLDEDQSIAALEEALAAGVVVEQPGSARDPGTTPFACSFSHVLIRETLYEEMSALRRARIHRHVGQALEQLDGEGRGADGERVAMLAEHFTRAAGPQDADKAIRYAMQAARRAIAMLAYEQAADVYARALALLERFSPGDEASRLELLLCLGDAYVRGGDRPLASAPLREAADLAIRRGDAESLARAVVSASRRYVQQPGVVDEELLGLLDRALEMTAEERSTLRVRLLARLCGALYYSSRRERMAAASAEATEIAAELDDPEARALAAAARRRTFWAPSRLDQRLSDSAELLRFAREAGDVELTLHGHAWLVVDLLEHGDPHAVDAQIEAFTDGAERLRQPLYLWQAAVWRAMRALLEGRLGKADRLATQALAVGARAEPVTAAQYYAVQLIAIRRDQGRMSELEQSVRQAIEQYPNRLGYRAALASLLAEIGRVDEARDEVDSLAVDQIPEDVDWLTTMTMLADLAADLGDAERADRLYALLGPYAEVNVVIGLGVVCEGAAARYLGRLAAATGRREEARRHFELALERNAVLGASVCLARTQLDYAQALGPARSRAARELIESAASAARQLDLPALARRAAALAG
jgi:DNA-binding SARP family transcriptional activator/tetratricopeptide (TPR) repeat protein